MQSAEFLNMISINSKVMQDSQEYFIIPELSDIKGSCEQFISPTEAKWRSFEALQEPPYQKIAKYMRNIEYNTENVRTFASLQKSMDYLTSKIFPMLLRKGVNQSERYSISIFLEERLKAIRTELFVQGIICPTLILRLIHANIILEIMKENTTIKNELVGLQHLIDPIYKQIMNNKHPQEYQSALIIAILSINKLEIQNLLLKHEVIFENERLMAILRLRLKLESNNYQSYYRALAEEEPLVQCLLWRKIEHFKQKLVQTLKKSFGDVSLTWLYKRLGFQQPENEGWINLKQVKQSIKGVHKGFSLWIPTQNLQSLLFH